MKITIKNRLAALIRMKGLRSASEFARRMTEAGFRMSSSHATRFEKEDMPATDLRFLNAVCNVLQCSPHDLYEFYVELGANEEIDPGLDLPSHTIFRRLGTPTAVQPPPIESAVAPVEPQQSPPPSVRSPKKEPKAPSTKPFDMDTGPKLTVFPYGKK